MLLIVAIIVGLVVVVAVVSSDGGQSLSPTPKPLSPNTSAASAEAAGYWVLPTVEFDGGGDESFYFKLKLLRHYTILLARGGGAFTAQGDSEPAWAIVANIEMLARHFPWIPKVLKLIVETHGEDIFDTMDPSRACAQRHALESLRRSALTNGWSYVIKDGPRAIFGSQTPSPAYGETLKRELLGEFSLRPANVRVLGIEEIIHVAPDGSQTDPVPLREWAT